MNIIYTSVPQIRVFQLAGCFKAEFNHPEGMLKSKATNNFSIFIVYLAITRLETVQKRM